MTSVKLAAQPLTAYAPVLGVYDGDTIHAAHIDVACGWRLPPRGNSKWLLVRLAGIAAREIHDDGGPEARDNLAALLGTATIVLKDPHPDEYGNRWDAWLVLPDGTNVNDRLVADGWALPWNGQGSQPKPAWPRLPQQGVGYVRAATEWKVGA